MSGAAHGRALAGPGYPVCAALRGTPSPRGGRPGGPARLRTCGCGRDARAPARVRAPQDVGPLSLAGRLPPMAAGLAASQTAPPELPSPVATAPPEIFAINTQTAPPAELLRRILDMVEE